MKLPTAQLAANQGSGTSRGISNISVGYESLTYSVIREIAQHQHRHHLLSRTVDCFWHKVFYRCSRDLAWDLSAKHHDVQLSDVPF